MKKKVLLLDVDGVLRDWSWAARKVLSAFTDIPKDVIDPYKRPKDWDWFQYIPEEHINTAIDKLFSPGIESLIVHRMAPRLEWAQKLYNFCRYNFETVICSAQPNPFLQVLTEEWLYNNIDGFDSPCTFVTNSDKKVNVDGDILVDDRLATLNLIYDERPEMETYFLSGPSSFGGDVKKCTFSGSAEEIMNELSDRYLRAAVSSSAASKTKP